MAQVDGSGTPPEIVHFVPTQPIDPPVPKSVTAGPPSPKVSATVKNEPKAAKVLCVSSPFTAAKPGIPARPAGVATKPEELKIGVVVPPAIEEHPRRRWGLRRLRGPGYRRRS